MNAANSTMKPRFTTERHHQQEPSNKTRAYKRSPELSNSRWYKGTLHSQLAGTEDNNGAFDFVILKLRPGTEPPPHVHSREHEFFYLLSGKIRFYVEKEVFTAEAGECVFIPCRERHTFLIASEEAEFILLITPGGFYGAFDKMSVPAQRMEMPTDAVTYADEDPTETIRVFEQYGTRFLTPAEIRRDLSKYPLPPHFSGDGE